MNPDTFMRILSLVEEPPIFHNRGRFPQISPMVQLMVALRRLGTETGSGSAVISVAQLFGIGEGTVLLYTHRVVVALGALWGQVIKWHNRDE